MVYTNLFTYPNALINYDYDVLATFSAIATTNVTAFKNNNDDPQNLTIGASSNVEIQFNDKLVFTNINNPFMTISIDSSNVTYITPAIKQIDINDLKITSEDTRMYLSTGKEEGVYFKDAVTFEQKALFNQNIVSLGDVTGKTMNLWTKNGLSNAAEVGYGFRIASNQQLELVKYSKSLSSNSMIKKVAIFGSTSTNYEVTDTSYLVFDELNGISMTGISNNTSSLSASNVSLYGNTTVYGNILPFASSLYNLGAYNKNFNNLYLNSNSTIFFILRK